MENQHGIIALACTIEAGLARTLRAAVLVAVNDVASLE